MNRTKQIMGVGLLTLVGTGFAMAQTPTGSTTVNGLNGIPNQGIQKMHTGKDGNRGKHKGMGGMGMGGKKGNMKIAHEAIIAGDFAKFQLLASTTPIGKIDQNTFTNLSTQMKIAKAAREQIQTILKNAGVAK